MHRGMSSVACSVGLSVVWRLRPARVQVEGLVSSIDRCNCLSAISCARLVSDKTGGPTLQIAPFLVTAPV